MLSVVVCVPVIIATAFPGGGGGGDFLHIYTHARAAVRLRARTHAPSDGRHLHRADAVRTHAIASPHRRHAARTHTEYFVPRGCGGEEEEREASAAVRRARTPNTRARPHAPESAGRRRPGVTPRAVGPRHSWRPAGTRPRRPMTRRVTSTAGGMIISPITRKIR